MVGDAKDVANVVAGGAAVAVAPMLMAVGSYDIVGTTGDTYDVPVAESPDPPARFRGTVEFVCVRTITAAAMIALLPIPTENHVSRCVRIDYLQRQTETLTSDWLPPIRSTSETVSECFVELPVLLYVGECSQSIGDIAV
jgi:hypothetical protein